MSVQTCTQQTHNSKYQGYKDEEERGIRDTTTEQRASCRLQVIQVPRRARPLGLDTHTGALAPTQCLCMAEASLRSKNSQLSELDDL